MMAGEFFLSRDLHPGLALGILNKSPKLKGRKGHARVARHLQMLRERDIKKNDPV
jgi:hypothetical protein